MANLTCVLQCLQSWRNCRRGVMIYSHLLVHHRHSVWHRLLIYPSFSYLSLPADSVLSLLFPPSLLSYRLLLFLTPYLLLPHLSHLRSSCCILLPPCCNLKLFYYISEIPPIFSSSPPVLPDWRGRRAYRRPEATV